MKKENTSEAAGPKKSGEGDSGFRRMFLSAPKPGKDGMLEHYIAVQFSDIPSIGRFAITQAIFGDDPEDDSEEAEIAWQENKTRELCKEVLEYLVGIVASGSEELYIMSPGKYSAVYKLCINLFRLMQSKRPAVVQSAHAGLRNFLKVLTSLARQIDSPAREELLERYIDFRGIRAFKPDAARALADDIARCWNTVMAEIELLTAHDRLALRTPEIPDILPDPESTVLYPRDGLSPEQATLHNKERAIAVREAAMDGYSKNLAAVEGDLAPLEKAAQSPEAFAAVTDALRRKREFRRVFTTDPDVAYIGFAVRKHGDMERTVFRYVREKTDETAAFERVYELLCAYLRRAIELARYVDSPSSVDFRKCLQIVERNNGRFHKFIEDGHGEALEREKDFAELERLLDESTRTLIEACGAALKKPREVVELGEETRAALGKKKKNASGKGNMGRKTSRMAKQLGVFIKYMEGKKPTTDKDVMKRHAAACWLEHKKEWDAAKTAKDDAKGYATIYALRDAYMAWIGR